MPKSYARDGKIYTMTPEEEAAFEAARAGANAPIRRRYSKVRLFGAMTDAEYDTFETVQAQQKKREQAIFRNAAEIDEGHPLYAKFEALMLGTYAAPRGQELLDAAVL